MSRWAVARAPSVASPNQAATACLGWCGRCYHRHTFSWYCPSQCPKGVYYRSTVYEAVYVTPLGRFSKVNCSTTKRVQMPNDASSERSRRDVYNADPFLAPALFQLWRYREWKVGSGGCDLHRSIRYMLWCDSVCLFLFLPVQQYKRHVRSIARSGVSPGGARSDGHH